MITNITLEEFSALYEYRLKDSYDEFIPHAYALLYSHVFKIICGFQPFVGISNDPDFSFTSILVNSKEDFQREMTEGAKLINLSVEEGNKVWENIHRLLHDEKKLRFEKSCFSLRDKLRHLRDYLSLCSKHKSCLEESFNFASVLNAFYAFLSKKEGKWEKFYQLITQ